MRIDFGSGIGGGGNAGAGEVHGVVASRSSRYVFHDDSIRVIADNGKLVPAASPLQS
jgi:hypothetical protein